MRSREPVRAVADLPDVRRRRRRVHARARWCPSASPPPSCPTGITRRARARGDAARRDLPVPPRERSPHAPAAARRAGLDDRQPVPPGARASPTSSASAASCPRSTSRSTPARLRAYGLTLADVATGAREVEPERRRRLLAARRSGDGRARRRLSRDRRATSRTSCSRAATARRSPSVTSRGSCCRACRGAATSASTRSPRSSRASCCCAAARTRRACSTASTPRSTSSTPRSCRRA